ncbi:MAG: PAS domain-containing protein [Devosiaceae bacterium]|nr:PAS domain-containing protein [Devosiaceae bacterium MH13]
MKPAKPLLQSVRDSWVSLTDGEQPLPTLGDLEAAGVPIEHPGAAILGTVANDDARQPAQAFRVVHAGADHLKHTGLEMSGQTIAAVTHPLHRERLEQMYAQIVETRTPHQWRCLNLTRNAPPERYERVLVPIADDQGDGRCLFGIWIWESSELA